MTSETIDQFTTALIDHVSAGLSDADHFKLNQRLARLRDELHNIAVTSDRIKYDNPWSFEHENRICR